VATLVFTPDRLAVIKAGPAVRRSYVDRALARLLPARATVPATYAEALAQRNAALRRAAAGAAGLDAVAPWTERLARSGGLVTARALTIAALTPGFAERAGSWGCRRKPGLRPSPATVESLEARLTAMWSAASRGRASPRRVRHRGRARPAGARLAGRTARRRAKLLLAEADILTDRRAVPPLLLLDDVLSELDGDRRAALVGRLRSRGQTLVTAAARGALPGDPDQLLTVSLGRVDDAR
jgi:DNA replication and repair protein RecF